MQRALEEIHIRRLRYQGGDVIPDAPDWPTFPDACPVCGAPRTDDPDLQIPDTSGPASYRRHVLHENPTRPIAGFRSGNPAQTLAGKNWATFACGGYYTSKPQIQNHTDKWWGVCGKEVPEEP